MSQSKRKDEGMIKIIEKRCSKCGHDRAWLKPRGVFCSRCGYDHSTTERKKRF